MCLLCQEMRFPRSSSLYKIENYRQYKTACLLRETCHFLLSTERVNNKRAIREGVKLIKLVHLVFNKVNGFEMNMLCVKLLILLVLTSSLVSAYRPDNSENTLGDTCKLENNEKGICSELSDCESAKKLFKLNKTSDILHCAFIGRRPIVCCPNGPQQLKNKNPKFIKALCMNTKPDLVINFNIVNGLKADVGEFPYQVALGYRGLGSEIDFRCGGSLIAEDIVISAAHCANKKTDLPVMVRLGRVSNQQLNSLVWLVCLHFICIFRHL